MRVLGLTFVGTATEHDTAMAAFLQRLLGTAPQQDGEGARRFALPDGSSMVVVPGEPGQRHRSVGLLVDDLAAAVAAVRAAGAEVGPVQAAGAERYAHFTAPDGHLYELIERTG